MSKRAIAKPVPGALAPVDARQALLDAAGLTPERQGELLRVAVQTAETAMTGAMSPLVAAGATPMPDWHARLGAARFLAGLLGAQPSKSGVGSGQAQVVVNIEMPEWARPAEPKQVGAGRSAGAGQVVDITGRPA
jgi:hypothetical protein